MAYSTIVDPEATYLDNPAFGIHGTNGGHWAHAPQSDYPEATTWNKTELITETVANSRIVNSYNSPLQPQSSPQSPFPARNSSRLIQPHRQEYYHINTNLTAPFREAQFSPPTPSPSTPASVLGSLESFGRYGGSTPSLASPSLPTPSTDKTNPLVLTPDGMQSARQLHGSPSKWNERSLSSPGLPYLRESGLTPDLGGMRLNSYEEPGFQLAGPVRKSQESSVLLGSNPGSESSQGADLDPLDFGGALADIGHVHGQVSAAGLSDGLNDENYNIHIVPPQGGHQSIPVTVSLDDPSQWDPTSLLLSPLLSLEALPMSSGEYQGLSEESFHDQFLVAIQPGNWNQSFNLPQTVSPTPSNVPSLHNSRPSPQIHSDPYLPTTESTFREGSSQPTPFRSFDNDTANSPRSALEAMRSGQPHHIVNPKGVSERTLAAAQANRKREAKFRCEICGNCQTSKQNLDNHVMSRHMQLKRFECPVVGCSAKYGHARGVNRHLDSKHPGFRQSGVKSRRSKVE